MTANGRESREKPAVRAALIAAIMASFLAFAVVAVFGLFFFTGRSRTTQRISRSMSFHRRASRRVMTACATQRSRSSKPISTVSAGSTGRTACFRFQSSARCGSSRRAGLRPHSGCRREENPVAKGGGPTR
jgi:hypothetical protein